MPNPFVLISENKTLSALWGIFTAAFFFTVQQWYTSDEQLAAVRTLATQVEEQRAEFDRATKAMTLHDKAAEELDAMPAGLAALTAGDALAPQNVRASTQRLAEQLTDARRKLAASRAVLGNLYFDLSALKELQAGLVKNLDQADSHLEKRIEFAQAMLTDFDKARQQAPTIRANADGERYAMESAARQATFEYILGKARREHNDKVAEANAQLRMYRLRSKLTLAAGTYMGLFAGGMGGWLVAQHRRRTTPSKPAEHGATPAEDRLANLD